MRRILPLIALALVACGTPAKPGATGFQVVTTVAPITDIARNVAGDAASVEGIIPEGTDSHTFEPTPASVKTLSRADLVLVNGLHLEDRTLDLARANAKSATIVTLGDRALDRADFIYDFSFPKSGDKPNPHLWMDVTFAINYAAQIRDALASTDPSNAAAYRANAAAYFERLGALDTAIQTAVGTIPAANRVLLTYHDSFAYFAKHYGMRVIGAIQPSDFTEPSAREVASLIDQIKAQKVPAIFGSEVFPSRVLDQIARETGITFVKTLSDDALPGEPRSPEHSYIGMMVDDVRTIVESLGGDARALNGIPTATPYD